MKIPQKEILIVIPARNEAEVIGQTLTELQGSLPPGCLIAVGLNGCSDNTREICEEHSVIIGETDAIGYGFGCQAAIDAVIEEKIDFDGILFFAADGANRVEDASKMIEIFRTDDQIEFLMGLRQFSMQGWTEEFGRALPNLILGVICWALGGQFFHDLGPLRLIDRAVFEKMALREMVWGWTIEAQIRAAQLKIPIHTLPVRERPRQAGEQKISGLSIGRSLEIGGAIAKAAVRTRFDRR